MSEIKGKLSKRSRAKHNTGSVERIKAAQQIGSIMSAMAGPSTQTTKEIARPVIKNVDRSYQRWNSYEDNMLVLNARTMNYRQLADLLHRTPKAVERRRARLRSEGRL